MMLESLHLGKGKFPSGWGTQSKCQRLPLGKHFSLQFRYLMQMAIQMICFAAFQHDCCHECVAMFVREVWVIGLTELLGFTAWMKSASTRSGAAIAPSNQSRPKEGAGLTRPSSLHVYTLIVKGLFEAALRRLHSWVFSQVALLCIQGLEGFAKTTVIQYELLGRRFYVKRL